MYLNKKKHILGKYVYLLSFIIIMIREYLINTQNAIVTYLAEIMAHPNTITKPFMYNIARTIIVSVIFDCAKQGFVYNQLNTIMRGKTRLAINKHHSPRELRNKCSDSSRIIADF